MTAYKKYTTDRPRKHFHINGQSCSKADWLKYVETLHQIRRGLAAGDSDLDFMGTDMETITAEELYASGQVPAGYRYYERRCNPVVKTPKATSKDIIEMEKLSRKVNRTTETPLQLRRIKADNNYDSGYETEHGNDIDDSIKIERRENLAIARICKAKRDGKRKQARAW